MSAAAGRILLALLVLSGAGCFDLDSFLHTAKHCSIVGPATCEQAESVWERVCKTCDEPYDWARDYPWVPGTASRAVATVERFTLPTDDGEGELDAYLLAAHGDNPTLAGTTVLYLHGNYAGIEHYQPRLRMLHELGYSVVTFDYRGYGKSLPATTPTGAQFFADTEQLRRHLDDLGIDSGRLVYYGFSLGGQPAMDLATRIAPCATVLEAPCPAVDRMVQDSSLLSMPGSFISSGDYDGYRKVGESTAPLFLLHGDRDDAFSLEGSMLLRDAAAGPARLWTVKDAPHGLENGIPETVGLDRYGAEIEQFLRELAPSCLGL